MALRIRGDGRASGRAAIGVALWLVLAILASAPPWAGAIDDAGDEPRTTMHRVYAALRVLLPLALDPEADPPFARRDDVAAATETLLGATDDLVGHFAAGDDPGASLLARALRWDVRELDRLQRHDDSFGASLKTISLVENCIACHARLPSARDFPLESDLVSPEKLASLTATERARFQVAVRRFDDALATWEGLFADPAASLEDLELEGAIVDYLAVCLRVKREPERAAAGLGRIAARKDAPRYLRQRVAGWMEALERFAELATRVPTLSGARALVDVAHAPRALPSSRNRLVEALIASSDLQQLAADPARSPEERAEAYYLLAGIQDRTASIAWVPQVEFHLDAAIRSAPGSDFAMRALTELEERTLFEYGGLSKDAVSDETLAELETLRALIDRQTPGTPADAAAASSGASSPTDPGGR